MKELAKYQGKRKTVQVAYEAGCLVHTQYRTLEEFRIDRRVIPPNTVFHGGEDGLPGRVKPRVR